MGIFQDILNEINADTLNKILNERNSKSSKITGDDSRQAIVDDVLNCFIDAVNDYHSIADEYGKIQKINNPNELFEKYSEEANAKYSTFYFPIPHNNINEDTTGEINYKNIFLPQYVYCGEFRRREQLKRDHILTNNEGLVALVPKFSESDSVDERWQYIYKKLNQQDEDRNADHFISDKGRYVLRKELANALIKQKDLQVNLSMLNHSNDPNGDKLTEVIKKLSQAGILGIKPINSYGDWHREVCRAFLTITHIPQYGDPQEDAKHVEEQIPVDVDANGGVYALESSERGALALHVDHINGNHKDNRLDNLRVVKEADNEAAAQTYTVIIWNITVAKPDFIQRLQQENISLPIRAELAYNPSINDTELTYIDNNNNIIPAERIEPYLAISQKVINSTSKEIPINDKKLYSGEGVLMPNNKLTLYQIPIIIGLRNGEEYPMSSAQEAAYRLNKNYSQIISWVRYGVKHSQINQDVPDNTVQYIGFHTNDVYNQYIQNRQNIPMTEESIGIVGDEYKNGKARQIVKNYGNVNDDLTEHINYQTIGEICQQILNTDDFKHGISKTDSGYFSVSAYSNERDDYGNISSPKYAGEKWYRGLYFDISKKNIGTLKQHGVGVYAGFVVDNKASYSVFSGKTAVDTLTGVEYNGGKCYYNVMCSDRNRIAFYNEKSKKFEIYSKSYFIQYPATSMFFEKYTINIGKGKPSLISKKERRDISLHCLMASTFRYNELLQFIMNYPNPNGYLGDTELFVHHINGDTAFYNIDNLEYVSSNENSLFDRGFTCLGLFKKIATKEIAVAAWPIIKNRPQRYTEKDTFEKYGETDEKLKNMHLPPINEALSYMSTMDEYLPEKFTSNGTSYFFRECITKDYRFENTLPIEAAKEIIGIKHVLHDGEKAYSLFYSTDDGQVLFTPEKLDAFFQEHPEIRQMNPNIPSIKANPNFNHVLKGGEIPRQQNDSQAPVRNSLNEDIQKIKSLMDRINK